MKKFIIVSPSFIDNVGGTIALHQLCHLLNEAKEVALMWPIEKKGSRLLQLLKIIYRFLRYFPNNRNEFKTFEKFNTPIAKYSDLKNAIVVYPEIVAGNPLGAKNVVRWLLHKPGFHTGAIDYSDDDLYFFYQKAFDDENLNPNGENLLQIFFIRHDIYYQTNFSSRKGTCYILRKGRNRELVHDTNESILIDDLSHEEIAKVFNSVEMCISYDLHTYYSTYAVLCGCISVVVPQEGLSKEAWIPEESGRYGIAYGFDDIEYAISTRELLLQKIKGQEQHSDMTVKNFIRKCEDYFGS